MKIRTHEAPSPKRKNQMKNINIMIAVAAIVFLLGCVAIGLGIRGQATKIAILEDNALNQTAAIDSLLAHQARQQEQIDSQQKQLDSLVPTNSPSSSAINPGGCKPKSEMKSRNSKPTA
jgi:hypothetical protein